MNKAVNGILKLVGFIAVVALIASGFEHLLYAKYLYDRVETTVATYIPIERLDNPNSFNRDYLLNCGRNDSSYFDINIREGQIREVFDELGIQLYFVDYEMEHNHRSSQQVVKDEIDEYINSIDNDLYGIYYVNARYYQDYGSPNYQYCDDCYSTEVQGYLIYGSEVDTWWSTDFQKRYEEILTTSCDYYGGYVMYDDFIQALSLMVSEDTEISNAHDDAMKYATEEAEIEFAKAFIYIGLSLTVVVLVAITSIAKAKRLKDKATAEILSTPISSLAEEELEGLKDEYSDEK